MPRTWKAAALAVLAMSAIAAGMACGGDSGDKLTLEEYFQRVDELENTNTEQSDEAFAAVTDEEDLDQVREAFGQIPDFMRELIDGVDALTPPDEAQEAHDELVAAGNDFVDQVDELVDDLDGAESTEALFAIFDDEDFAAADDRLTAACNDLQEVATDHDISVDLGCSSDE